MLLECKSWLSSGTYESGIDILRALREHNHIDEFTFKVASSGKSSFSAGKMRDAITLFVQKAESGDVKVLRTRVMPPMEAPKRTEEPKPKPDVFYQLPPDLQAMEGEIKALYSRNRTLRGRLQEIFYQLDGTQKKTRAMKTPGDVRKSIAFEIVRNQKLINRYWKEIDHFREHGFYSAEFANKPMLTFMAELLRDQPQMINYIRQSDSHFKKTGEHKNKERYDEYKSRLDHIDKLIDELL